MLKSFHRPLATLALIALAACSSSSNPPTPPNPSPSVVGLAQQNFVGIGDSLTFGQQSGGLLGVVTTSPVSGLPNNLVQPMQASGFWALMYAQMNGIALDPVIGKWNTDTALGATTSPLPLIAAPGLGAQLVVSAVSPPFAPTHSGCDGFNLQSYSATTWPATRVNPAGPIADLGVPGLTMHEAVSMVAPLTGPPNAPNCGYVTIPGDITSGGLQSLVGAESASFYPVLGQFEQTQGGKATELSAAVSLAPKLTTVWLGANDMLKFIFSHGQSPATDSPTQFATDLTTVITTLEKSGSKVVVGNLPDILGNPSTNEPPLPQFFPQTKLSLDLQSLGVPGPAAAQLAAYVSATYTKGNGGFLTESGFFGLVSQIKANPTALPNLDPNGPGSGDGALYLDQTFAAQAIALNAGYNQAINGVAAATGAGLTDIQTAFQGLAAPGGGLTLAPGVTLTLQFGGGILSYDGLHPANTGYAIIANLFIGAADTKFAMTIPPLSNAQIGAIAQNDSYNPFVIKAVNPAWPFPLP